jgi:hypothetical protein
MYIVISMAVKKTLHGNRRTPPNWEGRGVRGGYFHLTPIDPRTRHFCGLQNGAVLGQTMHVTLYFRFKTVRLSLEFHVYKILLLFITTGTEH